MCFVNYFKVFPVFCGRLFCLAFFVLCLFTYLFLSHLTLAAVSRLLLFRFHQICHKYRNSKIDKIVLIVVDIFVAASNYFFCDDFCE